MKITNVKINKVQTGNRVFGYATITFDDEFVVRSIKVIKKDDGTYVAHMPLRGSTKDKENNRKVYAVQPINNEARIKIETAITEAINQLPDEQEGADL